MYVDENSTDYAHENHETAPEVDSIPLASINDYLARRWSRVFTLAQDNSHDTFALSLAEFKSVWADLDVGVHFHIKFGPPKAKPISQREVLITYTANEILFYDSEDFTRQPVEIYEGWEIALIAEVKQVKETDGFGTRYVLDLDTARFAEDLSLLPGAEAETGLRYRDIITEFVQVQYLEALETSNGHTIYVSGDQLDSIDDEEAEIPSDSVDVEEAEIPLDSVDVEEAEIPLSSIQLVPMICRMSLPIDSPSDGILRISKNGRGGNRRKRYPNLKTVR
jgi:hypothetical protein